MLFLRRRKKVEKKLFLKEIILVTFLLQGPGLFFLPALQGRSDEAFCRGFALVYVGLAAAGCVSGLGAAAAHGNLFLGVLGTGSGRRVEERLIKGVASPLATRVCGGIPIMRLFLPCRGWGGSDKPRCWMQRAQVSGWQWYRSS